MRPSSFMSPPSAFRARRNIVRGCASRLRPVPDPRKRLAERPGLSPRRSARSASAGSRRTPGATRSGAGGAPGARSGASGEAAPGQDPARSHVTVDRLDDRERSADLDRHDLVGRRDVRQGHAPAAASRALTSNSGLAFSEYRPCVGGRPGPRLRLRGWEARRSPPRPSDGKHTERCRRRSFPARLGHGLGRETVRARENTHDPGLSGYRYRDSNPGFRRERAAS